MTNVIGYKGTATDRETLWKSLIMMREVVREDKKIQSPALVKEEKILEHLWQQYL